MAQLVTVCHRGLPPVDFRATAGYRRLPPATAGLPPGLGVFNGILDFAQNFISNHFLEIQ